MLGWAAVVPVSDRCAYAGVVEHSVYLDSDARGRGIALSLLQPLLGSTDAAGIWTVQSGTFPERAPPVRWPGHRVRRPPLLQRPAPARGRHAAVPDLTRRR
ncbi:hypothetical protein GCM10010289_68190 [Streptomyces violascens]|nr:hypothetical protein GCM10010289_68190 [Streptomyces violascens]